MEREILFRGKRVDNGEWIEGDLLTPTDIVDCTEIAENTGMGDRYDVDSVTVGQYTGLTDKNGKKIFEGDLIIEINAIDIDKTPRKVVWTNLSYMCPYIKNYWGYGDSCIELDFLYRLKRENIEVIGNIHDNPEMLEQEG